MAALAPKRGGCRVNFASYCLICLSSCSMMAAVSNCIKLHLNEATILTGTIDMQLHELELQSDLAGDSTISPLGGTSKLFWKKLTSL